MMNGKKGLGSIENYWGTKVSTIYITHKSSGSEKTEGSVNDIEHGEKVDYQFYFYYRLGLFSPLDYWKVMVHTMDGKIYSTNGYFTCSIKDEDNGKAIIGINGEAKTAYVAFPKSGSCSEKLIQIR
ncbi:hypothetical protein [Providencia alcalifaciens]|uniref:hypothetical protein n=1 Tax=Providencia alcalifaciens TaxID=126385 RepID=UPI001CC5C778|nr:hypothetical protein NVI2019_GHJFPKLH_02260 [Providencia alcalifaciens]